MASVLVLERNGSRVHRELRSDACREMRNQIEIVFIPCGVGLNPTDDSLVKGWWLELVLQEQFVCAIHVLEPAPNIIAFGKAKRGFRQISIPNQARFEAFVSSPQQSTGPVSVPQWPVVHDRGGHPPGPRQDEGLLGWQDEQ